MKHIKKYFKKYFLVLVIALMVIACTASGEVLNTSTPTPDTRVQAGTKAPGAIKKTPTSTSEVVLPDEVVVKEVEPTNTPEPTETLVPTATPTPTPPQDVPGVTAEDMTRLLYILQLFVNDALGPDVLEVTWWTDRESCKSDLLAPLYFFDEDGKNTGECVQVSDMCLGDAFMPCDATFVVHGTQLSRTSYDPETSFTFGRENSLPNRNVKIEEEGIYFYLYYLRHMSVEELEEELAYQREYVLESYAAYDYYKTFYLLIKFSSNDGYTGRWHQLGIPSVFTYGH